MGRTHEGDVRLRSPRQREEEKSCGPRWGQERGAGNRKAAACPGPSGVGGGPMHDRSTHEEANGDAGAGLVVVFFFFFFFFLVPPLAFFAFSASRALVRSPWSFFRVSLLLVTSPWSFLMRSPSFLIRIWICFADIETTPS